LRFRAAQFCFIKFKEEGGAASCQLEGLQARDHGRQCKRRALFSQLEC
jgi:hypothetical protein